MLTSRLERAASECTGHETAESSFNSGWIEGGSGRASSVFTCMRSVNRYEQRSLNILLSEFELRVLGVATKSEGELAFSMMQSKNRSFAEN